jgi:uncharacterized protein (DUF2236 family)
VITVTDDARLLAQEILHPPAPRPAAPALWLVRLQTIGLLPPGIRAGYGFSWSPRREAWAAASARIVRTTLRLTPPVIRHWPAARRAARRALLPA